ncbi:glycosyltransferase (plasmid) [Tundrisphaera sp. TA3]|uniref:glycosyltransferase n=1 Tax=Tundrisphaera sp. TA3 TaxID=3435775 RepID=UPI003EB781E0
MSDPRPVVAFLVPGGPASAMAERAGAFADRLSGEIDPRLVFAEGRRASAALAMLRRLEGLRPRLCYVLDIAAAGVAAAGMYRAATGTPMVVDTGDAVVELGRALGRGPVGMLATRGLEAFALRAAARVVVRGRHHRDLLARAGIPAEFVPDGVAVDQFAPGPDAGPRPAGRPLTIGLVGSCVWSPVRRNCYGWDLIELVRILRDRLPDLPVRGILIGDGSGVDVLKRRCEEYGLGGRIQFAGRVPYEELPACLRRIDICLSTQTNDAIGMVRTTGKLPLYLAAGRFVLASRVGEAARVLPPEMLVEYRGSSDPDYPGRLAERVIRLAECGAPFDHRPECVALAREHFDYDRLAGRVAGVIQGTLARRRGRPT